MNNKKIMEFLHKIQSLHLIKNFPARIKNKIKTI